METNYRKAFNSPYLSAADLVEPIQLTIKCVKQEKDKTKGEKTDKILNVAYFDQHEIRKGEKLKPMVLNVTNCKFLASIFKTPIIENWVNLEVEVFVANNIKFGRDLVEGLRLREARKKPALTPDSPRWQNAVKNLSQHKDLSKILAFVTMSNDHMQQIKKEAGLCG